jgi:hypothetical protein
MSASPAKEDSLFDVLPEIFSFQKTPHNKVNSPAIAMKMVNNSYALCQT